MHTTEAYKGLGGIFIAIVHYIIAQSNRVIILLLSEYFKYENNKIANTKEIAQSYNKFFANIGKNI